MGKFREYILRDVWRVMRLLAYHGTGKTGPFFEGWYFKLISPDGALRVSVIPGIYIGSRSQDSHSFVQVIDWVNGASYYAPFSVADFRFVPGEMDIRVAGSHFTPAAIHLDPRLDAFHLAGDLTFSDLNPDSRQIPTDCIVEPCLKVARSGGKFKFERVGYFCVDNHSTANRLVFNRTVGLRDTWVKISEAGGQRK